MIYLDNAATTFPKPNEVYNSVDDCIRNYCANPGRGTHNLSITCESKIFDCRERLSMLLNIENPLNIIFTLNATDSLNIAIKGVLKPGDHAITTMIEHNSVLRPLYSLKKFNIETTIIPVNSLGYLNINDIKKSIKKNTKAIIINHGSNVIGTIQNLEPIGLLAKSLGILFIVDASQTIGYSQINVKKMNINLLAFPGHKSLFGLQGTGGLYISDNIEISSLKEGGTGSNSESIIQPDFLPDKMESGTLNTPGIISLNEGIKFIFSKRIDNIRNHEISLMEYLTSELQKLPFVKLYGETNPQLKTPVLSFNIDNHDSSEVGRYLNSLNIYLRTSYHCAPLIHKIIGTERIGTVRVSPGYFNTFNDIETFILAIKNFYTHI